MSLQVECYSSIHVGLRRKNNQDAILTSKKYNIFCVADGLGGHLGGEVASTMAIASIHDVISQNTAAGGKKEPQAIVQQAFQRANHEVFDQSQRHIELKGMGTTLVLLWIHQGKIYIGNVGDSRGYLYRQGRLWQLTSDHTVFAPELKQGFEFQKKAEKKNQRSPLTQSVGFINRIYPDILTRPAKAGDIYLLCSDGLYGMVSNEMILDMFKTYRLNLVSKMCMIKALAAGGWDNISIVILKIVSC